VLIYQLEQQSHALGIRLNHELPSAGLVCIAGAAGAQRKGLYLRQHLPRSFCWLALSWLRVRSFTTQRIQLLFEHRSLLLFLLELAGQGGRLRTLIGRWFFKLAWADSRRGSSRSEEGQATAGGTEKHPPPPRHDDGCSCEGQRHRNPASGCALRQRSPPADRGTRLG